MEEFIICPAGQRCPVVSQRNIDHQWTSHNAFSRHESPVAAVPTVVAVVAHNKILSLGNNNFPLRDVAGQTGAPTYGHRPAPELGREVVTERVKVAALVGGVLFAQRCAVDIDNAVVQPNVVPGSAHYALHQILRRIQGKMEDNNVAPANS